MSQELKAKARPAFGNVSAQIGDSLKVCTAIVLFPFWLVPWLLSDERENPKVTAISAALWTLTGLLIYSLG